MNNRFAKSKSAWPIEKINELLLAPLSLLHLALHSLDSVSRFKKQHVHCMSIVEFPADGQQQGLAILAVLAGASLVKGHGYVVSWTANGETQDGADPQRASSYTGVARPTTNEDWREHTSYQCVASILIMEEFVDATGPEAACGHGAPTGEGISHWNLEAGVSITAQWTGPDIFDTPRGEIVPTADRGNWPGEHLGEISDYKYGWSAKFCRSRFGVHGFV